MNILNFIKQAIYTPPDDGDAVSFSSGSFMLIASPFVGWLCNVLTAVLVAFLSRLLWEFVKPLIEDFIGRKPKDFQDLTLGEEKKQEPQDDEVPQ